MASLMSAVNVQVDTKTKNEATAILKDLGMSMSTAINIFLKQVVKSDGLPFEVKNPTPTKDLRKALKQAEDIERNPQKYVSYEDVDKLFKEILDGTKSKKEKLLKRKVNKEI